MMEEIYEEDNGDSFVCCLIFIVWLLNLNYGKMPHASYKD
jgi:hypothetical protein